MSATILKAQAIAYVRGLFTTQEVAQVNSYGGEFTEAELSAKSFVCPAIFITSVGWHGEAGGTRLAGRKCKRVYMIAFVLAKSSDRETRAAQALAIAEKLADGLREWMPDSNALGAVISALEEEPSCENLYTRSLDQKGIARWMVKWDQTVKAVPGTTVQPGAQQVPLTAIQIDDVVHTGGDAPVAPIVPVPVSEGITFDNNTL